MLLNPDAAVLPGCLDALANTMQSRPGAGAVAPLVHWDEASGFLLPPQQLRSPLWECWQSLGLRVPALGRLISRRFRAENLELPRLARRFGATVVDFFFSRGGHP